jgi:hypothetical protein
VAEVYRNIFNGDKSPFPLGDDTNTSIKVERDNPSKRLAIIRTDRSEKSGWAKLIAFAVMITGLLSGTFYPRPAF